MPLTEKRFEWRPRALAAGIHLVLSAAIAGFAAILVFVLWYPGAYRSMAGGRELFLLVAAVDVTIGPVLTFVAFNRAKGARHLKRDLTIIGMMQLAALAYGLHTVYVARPVAMVFEVDRFRLVRANEVVKSELVKAPPGMETLSLTGPRVLGARRPASGAEQTDAMFMAVAGVDVGLRPMFWQPYEETRQRARDKARPLSALLAHYPSQAPAIREGLRDMAVEESNGRFLPVMARNPWIAVMDASGAVRGYLAVDGFF